MARIIKLDGVGEDAPRLLRTAGIASATDLLKRGATRNDVRRLARQVGVTEKIALRWVNRAGLLSIQGISSEYADLLRAGGVHSAAALARRNPQNLLVKLAKANAMRPVPQALTLPQVADWIKQAQELSRRAAKTNGNTAKRQVTRKPIIIRRDGILGGLLGEVKIDIEGIDFEVDEIESPRGLPGGGGTDNLP